MLPHDLAYGMQIAQIRRGQGLGNLKTPAEEEVDRANTMQNTSAIGATPGGSNSVLVDPKVNLLDPKGGVTLDSYEGTTAMVPTQLAPVPPVTALDRFNNLSTPAKVGAIGGGVVVVAGLLWLLKG